MKYLNDVQFDRLLKAIETAQINKLPIEKRAAIVARLKKYIPRVFYNGEDPARWRAALRPYMQQIHIYH